MKIKAKGSIVHVGIKFGGSKKSKKSVGVLSKIANKNAKRK